MVVKDTVKYSAPEPGYSNEMWRAKHGYKELHQHAPPIRRNRDFKAMPYGTAAGMPNYRHAEAWCQLKNISDFVREDNHFPTRFFKLGCLGGMWGFVLGAFWVAVKPQQGFVVQKLMARVGERDFSFRMPRAMAQVMIKPTMIGAGAFVTYGVLREAMRHHQHTERRPVIIDHIFATTLMGMVAVPTIARYNFVTAMA
jgi:hypothetical protein